MRKNKTKASTYCVIGVVLGIMFGTFMGVMAKADSFGNAQESEPISSEPISYEEFFSLFREHTGWRLEYRLTDSSSWKDGSDYLTVERTQFNDTGYWKYNLILDVPVPVYCARFIFSVDLPVLDYAEKTGNYEYLLNYSGYSCVFNWSDMAQIPNIEFTHGIYDNMFFFRFQRDNIPAGHYEFDPWFGHIGYTAYQGVNIEDRVYGTPFMFESSCDQGSYPYVQNITARVYVNENHNLTYGIYNNSSKVLIAQTPVINVTTNGDYLWITINFTTPVNLTLYDNTVLLLVAYSNDTVGECLLNYNVTTGYCLLYDYNTEGNLPNPFVQSEINCSRVANIYCNYTCFTPTQNTTNATLDDEGCYCFSLAPSLLGFILIFILFFSAERKLDAMLYIFTGVISLVMGVYYLILLDGINFTSWIGVILILFGVYMFFLALAYSKNIRKR